MEVTFSVFQYEISALKVLLYSNAEVILVISLVSQKTIDPYSISEHKPSVGLDSKHALIAS